MNRSILKPILFGVLFGAAAFFVPFMLIKMILFLMIISFIFRMFWWGGRGHRMHYQFAYADKIRNMSEEEYTAFKSNVNKGHCCHHYGHCDDDKQKAESKS
jgi:hypothetical protein